MKYQIDKQNYHLFHVIENNKLPCRSYFIPYEDQAQCDGVTLPQKRYQSPKVQCLNGTWDFKFYPKPAMLPDVLDTDEVTFDPIDVPACWQFRGYAKPFYVNTRYQFPYAPPKIPTEQAVGKTFCVAGSDYGIYPRWQTPVEEYNYVGVYRRKLYLNGSGKTYIISFLGVASCMDLYVNGAHVGYSEGSHNTAEFDISGYLTGGENELLVVVRRWCTGTYLECQDMFRNNGIFRDVLLFEMNECDIWDVSFSCRKEADGYLADVSAQLNRDAEVAFTLSGHGLLLNSTVKTEGKFAKAAFSGLDVLLWSAEAPVLYDLYISVPGSCVKLRVGFKTVEIRGDLFTLNGQKLKLRGVNHHDTSCDHGYYLTADQILQDVQLCKDYNIDTIRTSHYPPDPLLLEACDELGVYVVDEADLETHGTFTMQIPPSYNSLSHDPKWERHFLDRAVRLYGRDKNHTSIIMWSLGNESGGYRNTDVMYRYLKERTTIPVHYESAIYSKRVAYDVVSEMYPPLEKVKQTGEHNRKQKQFNDRPYFMCEYAHAMGVGPGGVEEYWQEIYSHDNLMGGCVWEMIDHAVRHPDGSYTYGGDHGEWEHDSNFCVDGLFYPDRTPSTGAKVIRHVYRPIRVRHLEGAGYEIFNTQAFTGTDAYEIRFCFADGTILIPPITPIPPLTKCVVDIPQCVPRTAWVNVVVIHKGSGRKVSTEQIVFSLPVLTDPKTDPVLPVGIDLEDGKIVFNKDGKKLCAGEQSTILFRAPTDNDRDFTLATAMDDFLEQREELLYARVENSKLTVQSLIHCPKHRFRCTDTYESCDGGVLVTSHLHCEKGKGDLPRFGKVFYIPESFDLVRYLGRDGESYCDMKEHAQIGSVECTVADMTEPNIKPQESGNRCDCVWVSVSDGETAFSATAVDRPFELGMKPYSDWELVSMKHQKDEKRTGTYLTVSAFQMGIGTGSCGPATLKTYRYPAAQDYTLRFLLK